MAHVGRATHVDIDHLLDRAIAGWEELTEVEQEIDGWDLIDQIVFIEEWPLEEERLRRLARYAQADDLTEGQRLRYEDLLRLVERQRPIITRLQHS
ncbi:MAG: hypothetical protein ACJ8B9_05610 [Microvirga sp.]